MSRSITHTNFRAWTTRRAFHASTRALAPENATNNVRESLRHLLQHTAQPVSVLTVKNTAPNSSEPYHGATLSSFSSVSFHPFPIISFALQLPSRSADALQSHFSIPTPEAQLVINILSSSQSDLARRFSRPDLYPKPFLERGDSNLPEYRLTNEGIPAFTHSVGALSCTLLASLPLNAAADGHRLATAMESHTMPSGEELRPGSAASMLYLARVLRVEDTSDSQEAANQSTDKKWPLPLLYHRKTYTTVGSAN